MKTVNKIGLGVVFCAAFLGLALFGFSVNVVKVQTKPAPVNAAACSVSGPSRMKVTFTSVQNEPKTVRLTNGSTYGDSTFFDITNADGSAITNDPSIPMNIISLVAKRSQGKVEFYIHNNQREARINGTITIEGATITNVMPSVDGLVSPYGGGISQGNTRTEVAPLTNADGQSDTLVVTSSTTLSFGLHFNEPGDAFTVSFAPCTPAVITCSSNSQCGTNGLVGATTCNSSGNPTRDYRTWTCNNPNTTSSTCTYNDVSQQQTTCNSNQTCSSGTCVTNGTVTCSTNSQCGTDGLVGATTCNSNGNPTRNYRTWTCNQAGTTNSTCTYNDVSQQQTTCNSNQTCTSGVCVTNGTITCSNSSQCGTNGLVGATTCNSSGNPTRNYRTWTCNNPNTTSSTCTYNDVSQQQTTCNSNQTCSAGACVTNTSNLTVSCYASPNPVDTNSSTAFTSNVSGGTGSYTYAWSGACIGSSQNCSNSFSSAGSYGVSLNVVSGTQSANATCFVAVNQQTTSANMTATVQVRNLSAGNLNWSNSVAAAPSDILQFNVVIRANSTNGANNITVRDILPSNLYYNNFLTIDGASNSGSITTGVNIGNLPANQTKTLTYQVQVAPSQNFVFGTTTLTNAVTATSTDTYNNIATGSASVAVTMSGVLGATDVSTGLTDNIFVDSFFIPLILALLGVWAWKSGLLNSLGFAGWVSAKKANYVKSVLEQKIEQIKSRENL